MHTKHSERDEGAAAFHAEGELAPSSQSAASAGTVIKFPFQAAQCRRPLQGLEDASSSDWDVPPTIGELAIKLVATWKLPRIVVMTVRGREEP